MSSADAGPSIVVASRSPARPEEWSPEDRDAAAAESRKVYDRYMSDEYTQAVDAIHNFKSGCEARKVDYADAFLSGDMTVEEYKKVDAARKHLMKFWKDVRLLYKECKLTADGIDFFAPEKRWLRQGNNYRALVEPLDIANWYKAGNKGHYIDQVKETEEKTKRPSQYAFLDRLMRDAGGDFVYSLSKAEDYKREAKSGDLQIHSLSDARADPPRGFKRISPLQVDVSEKTETGIDLSESPIGVLDKKDSTPPPTPAGFETLGPDLKVDGACLASTPPGWQAGVRYKSITGHFKAPRRQLLEPKYGPNNKTLIPADATWVKDARAPEVKVDYNAVVYKTEKKTHLVVRAKIFCNVILAHDALRHCGYFQESLTFWMNAPRGAVEISPGTVPLPGQKSEVNIKIVEKQGVATNLGATAGVQGSAAGPTGSLSVNAGRTWTGETAEERAYRSECVGMTFQTDEEKVAWTWTANRMEDGSPYAMRAVKGTNLGVLSTFARTSSLLEVQGTWSFPKDTEESVTLQAYVGQTLRYDAALERATCCGSHFRLKTCVDSPDEKGVVPISIPLSIPTS